jgi:Fe-S-cluster-containing dehydrogenase component/formate-dependent nitrite reductase membrane component NrfD
VNYGFLIDNRLCIGCHACSTACKQENRVPLGVYRTWVKYVEKGAFPHTRRLFQVTRCNHCANPPCVRICPVEAMYQRADGIVDFDPRVCIGCKACLQACPYDAIYVDPDGGTAAKCHYCAHRVEVGLEPACVIVCPEQAIVAGDLDDPASKISRMVAQHTVTVRRPEQGTAPKLFYIDGDQVSLSPSAAAAPGAFVWAELATDQARAIHTGTPTAADRSALAPVGRAHSMTGAALRAPLAQGLGTAGGAIHIGPERVAEQMVQVAYNAQHHIPWHWPVPAYMTTKAVAGGLMLALAVMFWLGPGLLVREFLVAVTGTALLFTLVTAALLVLDLEKPERFVYILLRPQWRSWLTRGAFILLAFSAVVAVWFAIEAGVALGLLPTWLSTDTAWLLVTLGGLLGVATAAYTAFLFGQAEGRDLWQSPLMPAHLTVQAVMAGAAVLLLVLTTVDFVYVITAEVAAWTYWLLVVAILVDLGLVLFGDLAMPHASESAARAAHAIRHGRYSRRFWYGAVMLGHVVPLFLLFAAVGAAGAPRIAITLGVLASFAVLVGLYVYEHAFVMAPQEIPNS